MITTDMLVDLCIFDVFKSDAFKVKLSAYYTGPAYISCSFKIVLPNTYEPASHFFQVFFLVELNDFCFLKMHT